MSSKSLSSEICDGPNMGSLLDFNNTVMAPGLNVTYISQQLCGVDKTTATEIGDYLIKEMDIGTLIQNVRVVMVTDVG